MLWIPATLAAAAAQTARNATQRRLTETIGTAGATQVRFLYGFPFALVFLSIALTLSGERLPRPDGGFFAFVVAGAVAQILATALMLAAMRERSFAVVTAYVKTEPVQTALVGLLILSDPVTPGGLAAILVATAGVIVMSGVGRGAGASWRPALLGLAAGAFFALSAIGFRGAILALDSGGTLIRASTTLAWGLGLQTLILTAWLLALDRPALTGSLRAWRPSIAAGFLGALASQFWFLGFALTTAANVRTLALVEVLMAQAVSRRLFAQGTSGREWLGLVLVTGGVGALLWFHA
ncbi:DMT family transporter [Salinarimonas soli]|uniref:DMT family transporter n=1 Tax=Salinarimonas soli TaxID=1638099 RepID=A0A5B2V9Z8_9HYPH|nr:DMT family transporter [Salinarimonas soli]